MLVLGVDTSTSINTAGLWEDGRVLGEVIDDAGRKHSERLLATIEWVLDSAGVSLADLDALAVSVGPGSFTGLRVGVSTMKGLALGANAPLVGVPTLDAMARLGAFHDEVVCPVLDAKMKEVYAAAFRFEDGVRTKVGDDCVDSVERFVGKVAPGALYFGDGAVLYADEIARRDPSARFGDFAINVPRGSAVATEGSERIRLGYESDAASVSPVYLRKSQPEEARAVKGEV